jgi:hypothetical protein
MITLVPSDALKTRRRSGLLATIRHVLSVGDESKIVTPVIQSIAIYMIHFDARGRAQQETVQ